MPLIYENPKKLRKLRQELFLMFEESVFPQISKELPAGYVIEKYLFGMPDKKNTSFVKSNIPKSLFNRSSSNKIIGTLMNRKMECGDQKKAFKAMSVAVMGGG